MPPFTSWKFVSLDRRITDAGTLEDAERFWHICTTGAFLKVCFSAQG
jgi:hypothetical protein